MKQDNYFLTLSLGLLKTNQENGKRFTDWLQRKNPSIDLVNIRSPNKISISVLLSHGLEMSLIDWIQRLQKEGLVEMRVDESTTESDSNLPRSVASAFLNGTPKNIYLKTKTSSRSFGFFTQQSGRYLMTSIQLFELIEAQTEKAKIWDYLIPEINEFLGANQFPLIDPKDIKAYFSKDSQLLESYGEEVLSMLHDVSAALGSAIFVPQSLRDSLVARAPVTDAFDLELLGIPKKDETNTDEELSFEAKLARARSRRYAEAGWRLAANPNPYLNYILIEDSSSGHSPSKKISSIQSFMTALNEAIEFSEAAASQYFDHFKASALILNSHDLPLIQDSANRFIKLGARMEELGLSADKVSSLISQIQSISDLRELSFSESQFKALAASTLADVFGGMGSWNDLYLEDERLTKMYPIISENLYSGMCDALHYALQTE